MMTRKSILLTGIMTLLYASTTLTYSSAYERLKKMRSAHSDISLDAALYLKNKMDEYHSKQKQEVIVPFRNCFTDKTIDKALSFISKQSSSAASLSKMIFLLTRELALYGDINKLYELDEECSTLNDAFLVDVTLQASGILIGEVRSQLLGVLDEINVALTYWQDQKNHPLKYYFHKSPIKWVAGKSQDKEVLHNIRMLEIMLDNVYALLGRITQHVYAFDSNFTNYDSRGWITELISLLAPLGTFRDNDGEEVAELEKSAKTIRFYLGKSTNVKNTLVRRMSFAKIPGHFARNWMWYVAGAVILYKGHDFYCSNTQDVENACNAIIVNAGWAWHQAIDPIKDGWETIFGKAVKMSAVDEAVEAQELVTIVKNASAITENSNVVIAAIENLGPDSMCEASTKQLYDLLSSNGYSDSDIEQVVKNLLSKSDKVLYISPKNAETLSKLSSKLKPLFSLQLWMLQNKLPYAPLLDSIFPMVGNISSMASSFARLFSIYAPYGTKARKQLALTSKLIAFIPATGVGYGTYKLYKHCTEVNYSPIRLGLVDINAIFIESNGTLNEMQYGNLLYLLYTLKIKAIQLLPKKNNVRAEFLADIAKLESQHFSVKAKRRMVDNMFNKYTFLSTSLKSA